jgi:hypothetical protein
MILSEKGRFFDVELLLRLSAQEEGAGGVGRSCET